MKAKTLLFALLVPCLLSLSGCYKDDIDDLKKQAQDHEARLAALEQWQTTVNGNISSLQGLVSALENNDYVTSVIPITEGGVTVGYTIHFTKSNSITIRHGEKGETGEDGQTPRISVKQHTDGKYYWMLDGEWLLDADDKMIPTTGADGTAGAGGATPKVRINTTTNMWEISADGSENGYISTGIKATGDKGATGATGAQGDAIFKKDGIDNTNADYVVLTLADGVTELILPKVTTLTVGFDNYDLFYGSSTNYEIPIILPSTFKETDYIAISARITDSNGTEIDVKTRANSGDAWLIIVKKPTFTDGVYNAGSAKVILSRPPANVKLSETAMLTVTITDKDGKDYSVSRPVKYFDGTIVENNTEGGLSTLGIDPAVTHLAIKGTLGDNDFTYIKNNLSALEVLDISMTDLFSLPDNALWYSAANTTLKKVSLPYLQEKIGYAAFGNCAGLEYIDAGNISTLGSYAFWNCINLREIKFGNRLAGIGTYAFSNCHSLATLDLPNSLHTLAVRAFANSGLVSITIPTSITQIPDYTFEFCKNLERITLHDGINDIGAYAFQGCRSLTRIRIPAKVTFIKEYTFSECSSLRFVYFHNGITEIGNYAFFCCSELQAETLNGQFTLPESLGSLGEGAFSQCENLRYVQFPAASPLTDIPQNAFHTCTNLRLIELPVNLETIGDYAFGWSGLTQITLPKNLVSIGGGTFTECKNLVIVNVQPITPPMIETNTFDSNYKSTRDLVRLVAADYSSWADYFNRIW